MSIAISWSIYFLSLAHFSFSPSMIYPRRGEEGGELLALKPTQKFISLREKEREGRKENMLFLIQLTFIDCMCMCWNCCWIHGCNFFFFPHAEKVEFNRRLSLSLTHIHSYGPYRIFLRILKK